MSDIFRELIDAADRSFNVVWLSTKDAVKILDDLYEFRKLMQNNGYDYGQNEREGKTNEELNDRITSLGHLLIGRKEFDQYLEQKESYISEYDKGYYKAMTHELKKKQQEKKEE